MSVSLATLRTYDGTEGSEGRERERKGEEQCGWDEGKGRVLGRREGKIG